jgi:hypothetical protein
MRKIFFPTLVTLLAATLGAYKAFGSQDLKKVPQSYWLSPETPTKPVKIGTSLKTSQNRVLIRDPNLSRKRDLSTRNADTPPPREKPRKIVKKTMKISKVRISGELTIPSVSFTPERPELTFARDQPVFPLNTPLPLNKP